MNSRLTFPGELSIQLGISRDFTRYNHPPWPWLQEHATYVRALIDVFIESFFEDTDASPWQRVARRRDLIRWMRFDETGSCPMREIIEGWSARLVPAGMKGDHPAYLYLWRK
jgi:hypothetical protein